MSNNSLSYNNEVYYTPILRSLHLFPLGHRIANKHIILFASERKQGLRESLLDKIKTESVLGKQYVCEK